MSTAREPSTDPGADDSPAEYVAAAAFGQRQLWMVDQLLPVKEVYNEARTDRILGALDVDALVRAFAEIVRRHDVLRTRFVPVEGDVCQRVALTPAEGLVVEDLSGWPPAGREEEAQRRMQAEIDRPFDLRHGPVYRARLFRLADDEHWLSITLHHIVHDRWSAAVLARELSTLYAAFVRGLPSPLPELPVQYADYAEWLRELVSGERQEALLAWWKRALDGLPALSLPTDRPRPAIATFSGARVEIELDAVLTDSLIKLSRRFNATLFMTMLAGFHVLLGRWSGQDDIPVGVPVTRRTRLEFEVLIGFFVNMVVMRGDLRGDPTFAELLERVRGFALDAYAHADLPIEQLVEALAPERDLARNPLYQVGFRLGNTPPLQLDLAGLSTSRLEGVVRDTAKFDLAFAVNEQSGRLRVHAEYATDLFDRATIVHLMEHYRHLLEAIVADPARPVSRLPLVDAAERRRLLVEWNATTAPAPLEKDAVTLFEEQAARTPDATAVLFARRRLDYRTLDAHANRLAHRLRALGVDRDVPVAVAMERSVELVVALLGILKAGGTYLPLDPEDPSPRLARLLAESGAPVLLSGRNVLESLPPFAGKILCPDDDGAGLSREPASPPPRPHDPARLAYIVHTSGSTGHPKGAMIEHRSLVNHLACAAAVFTAGPGDCVLQTAALGFDQSIWQMLFPLVSGGRVALPEPGAHRVPEEVVADIRRHGVTILRTVPTLLAALVDGPGLRDCPSLRLVIAAGEVLERRLADAFAAQCRAELVNAYGPTEATFVSTFHRVGRDSDGLAIPIGRPLGNVRIYVLDPHGEPAPIGVPGELFIGGAGVGRGYWKRPDLTAEAFVADPFSADPGSRMYRTGDQARFRADGHLEFLGRRDRQVKVRGIRIELAEIEATLALHPGLRQCAVTFARDPAGEPCLVAYFVVRAATEDTTPGALQVFLRERLPGAMVPAWYVALDALPQTASGKIDRASLPAPGAADHAAAGTNADDGPRNATEARIAAVWQEVLGLPRVGVHQGFFDLGGHSLLAIQILARAEAELGSAPTLRDFFADPTIAGMAAIVDAARQGPDAAIGDPDASGRGVSAEATR